MWQANFLPLGNQVTDPEIDHSSYTIDFSNSPNLMNSAKFPFSPKKNPLSLTETRLNGTVRTKQCVCLNCTRGQGPLTWFSTF